MSCPAECVPNFSEGHDATLLDRLGGAMEFAGAALLDRHADPDHNRSVYTLAGSFPALQSAVLASAGLAVQGIDLRVHRGAHPRVGAIDVVPVVPLDPAKREACVDAAREIGERLWEELRVPVYYYGKAARTAARARLESIRKLGFERLCERIRDGESLPDVGGPTLHSSAGACCVGVRAPMAAFNVQLAGSDDRLARRIASAVRESNGGLPGVKALGLYLPSARVAQVSMNLTRLDETPVFAAFDAVSREALRLGVTVLDTELVGLVPRAALGGDPARLRIRGFRDGMILEECLERVGARASTGSNP